MRVLALALLLPSLLADPPMPVKIVVVTMFERGEDSGDQPGELQLWVEREALTRRLRFLQGYRDLRMKGDGVLAVHVSSENIKQLGVWNSDEVLSIEHDAAQEGHGHARLKVLQRLEFLEQLLWLATAEEKAAHLTELTRIDSDEPASRPCGPRSDARATGIFPDVSQSVSVSPVGRARPRRH